MAFWQLPARQSYFDRPVSIERGDTTRLCIPPWSSPVLGFADLNWNGDTGWTKLNTTVHCRCVFCKLHGGHSDIWSRYTSFAIVDSILQDWPTHYSRGTAVWPTDTIAITMRSLLQERPTYRCQTTAARPQTHDNRNRSLHGQPLDK